MSEVLKRGQIVMDKTGNHFCVLSVSVNVAHCESVATKEIFSVPITDLFATDREVF